MGERGREREGGRERERERKRERGREREGEREGERENLECAPCSAWSPTRGPIPRPWYRDLSRNQESDAQPTEPPAGAPPTL